MQTQIIQIDPRALHLLEVNARFMPHEKFVRLVENVKRDGKLTSVPFAAVKGFVEGDDPWNPDVDGDPEWEVLSGNHRTMAAIEAGLPLIDLMVTWEPMSKDKRIAFQLAHNAIDGEDDPSILRRLYAEISDVNEKMYSGLDDKTLDLLAEVSPVSLSEVNLDFNTITITFLPDELEAAKLAFEDAKKLFASDEAWVARFAEYDLWLDTLEAIGGAYNVKNMAASIMVLLEMYMRHVEELQFGWWDKENNAALHEGWVPIASILGDTAMPASAAAVVMKAVKKMVDSGNVAPKHKWKALELLAADYLAGK